MIKETKNKQIKDAEDKELEYFYPSYGVTIKASSKEEADKKLADLVEQKQKE